MRTRLTVLSALLGIALISSLVAGPAQAAEKEIEGTVLHPVPGTGPASFDGHADMLCSGELPAEGTHYDWIDLEGEFKKFELAGPPHIVSAADAGGVMGDHDLDWFFYDAKCKDVTTHTNGPESGMKVDTRRPAQYVLVIYWFGIYPDLPYTIAASN